MPLFSIPSFRLRPLPLSPTLPLPNHNHRRRLSTTLYSSNRKPNPSRKPPPEKHLLKAKDAILHPLSSSPSHSFPAEPHDVLPDQAVGLVASAQANFMWVVVESPVEKAGRELLCVVRAVLKKIGRRVLVGDRVMVGAVDWVDGRGMIEEAFARRTVVDDPPVANVDRLVVVFSLEQPKVEPFSLTRFLVEAESTGIPVSLVMNKTDLVADELLSSWETRLHDWGYTPLFCSVDTKYGLKKLEATLRGKTSVVAGPSGVGKSSLINALRQGDVDHEVSNNLLDNFQNEGQKWFETQRVGTVSKRSGRGKHTTRHVSLLPLSDGGYLADTPGFNQPNLMQATKSSLAHLFPEIRQMLRASEPSKCSFNDCLHVGEPGCLVKGDWERYPYYLQLLDEIKIREEFQLRTLGTKRESDVRYKTGDLGIKQAEPRLQIKKHRRVSRKRINQSILDDLEEDY